MEILIVGGAAGLLTGQLAAAYTTGDVDMVRCHLAKDHDAVLEAAVAVARRLGTLPPAWLNTDAGLFAWTLPRTWRRRAVEVVRSGRLRVLAAGRFDLIVMKFLAHRPQDMEHLQQLAPTPAERGRVTTHLEKLRKHRPNEAGRIDLAMQIIKDQP